MLHYQVIGEGYPIVFLHGFLESSEIWKFLHLENQGIQSILIDLPGHGQSDMQGVTDDLSEYAQKVFDIIDYLEIDDFGLVGHSMGGYIAMEMARQRNEIEKVVLLNSNFWQDSDLKKNERKRVLEILEQNKQRYLMTIIPLMFQYPERDKAFIDTVIQQASQMSKEAIVTATKAMMSRINTEGLATILGKNLKIIQGELDTTVPLTMMMEKCHNQPYDLSILKATGHMSYIEASEDVITLIMAFFKDEI